MKNQSNKPNSITKRSIKLQEEKTNEYKAWIDLKYKHTSLTFVPFYSLLLISRILLGMNNLHLLSKLILLLWGQLKTPMCWPTG